MELNKKYTSSDDEDSTKRLQDMYILMSANYERFYPYGYIQLTPNNTNAYDKLCQYINPTSPLQTYAPTGVVTLFQSDNTVGKSFADVT